MTELLYTKQTQLERMAAEKATQQLAHERQIAQAKDDAERVKRCALAYVLVSATAFILNQCSLKLGVAQESHMMCTTLPVEVAIAERASWAHWQSCDDKSCMQDQFQTW